MDEVAGDLMSAGFVIVQEGHEISSDSLCRSEILSAPRGIAHQSPAPQAASPTKARLLKRDASSNLLLTRFDLG